MTRALLLLAFAAGAAASPSPSPSRTPASPAPSPQPAASPIDAAALTKDGLKPIDIDADLFEVNGKEKHGVFKGNVVARQGDVTIRASQVDATYSKVSNTILKAVAEGGVTVTSGAKVGKADRAEFNNDQHTIVLSGEPRLWEEGSVLEGKEIIFHVDDGRVECFDCSLAVDPTRIQQMQEDVNHTKKSTP